VLRSAPAEAGAGNVACRSGFRSSTKALQATLASDGRVAGYAAERALDDQCAVLGRGFHYATAREWALKVKELGYVLADPYSAADFQHGPIALVEPGYPVLAIATTGPALPEMLALLERLRASGARLLVASDDAVPLDAHALRPQDLWRTAMAGPAVQARPSGYSSPSSPTSRAPRSAANRASAATSSSLRTPSIVISPPDHESSGPPSSFQ
jgi:hypothetical protein